MPHVTDRSWQGQGPWNSRVSPRTSVDRVFESGACSDGNGQALWTVQNTAGNIEVWRTRAGFMDLSDSDNSVDYLTTICTRIIYGYPGGASLTRIGGRPYCVVNGKDFTDGIHRAGAWVYRDTSESGDGSGPWVLHGTIQNLDFGGNVNHFGGDTAAGEIIVENGVWATPLQTFINFGAGYTTSNHGVARSTDAGATWQITLQVGWYSFGAYGYYGSRNLGKRGGKWWWGGNGNVDGPKSFSSPDFLTWTDTSTLTNVFDWGGAFGGTMGQFNGSEWPVSTPNNIWRLGSNMEFAFTSGTPDTHPTYLPEQYSLVNLFPENAGGNEGYNKHPPLLCNIGPEDSPFWVWTRNGWVISNRGWVVGSVGRLPTVGVTDNA